MDTSWIDRLRIEYSDLVEKVNALDAFITADNDKPNSNLDEHSRRLLIVQLGIMEAYQTVLEARILATDKSND